MEMEEWKESRASGSSARPLGMAPSQFTVDFSFSDEETGLVKIPDGRRSYGV